MTLVQIIALLAKLGPKAIQAWPYVQQIIEAVQNILSLLQQQGVAIPAAAGKPDPNDVAQLIAAGATPDEAEQACTTLAGWEQVVGP